jgi:hypothetical protein
MPTTHARNVSTPTLTPPATELSAGPVYPGHEEIARRAYELYEGRGGTDGRDVEDWLEAEMQLLQERRLPTAQD